MDDLEFIKKFNKITIKKICNKLGVDDSNLYNGRVKKEKVKMIREELEKEIKELKGGE